ncbi:DUF2752 domain-containing protein [Leptospira sp. 201903071]|uniref:DUF2752 domain-containing protein n=1 Tax=Leptospira ainazelensis TaxID=2810034 RepID=UPI0019667457|nr:DUF2752 domain-containing protein [Leptospira ainazelensis]MBM9502466.1 DUF2752 domain-containing protein [Leptospira ainazelensis]
MPVVSKLIYKGHGIFVRIRSFEKSFRFLFVVAGAAIFFWIPEEFIYDPYPLCLFRFLLDWECWGCGTTRGFWCILHFRFEEASRYNPGIWFSFPLFVFCLLHWVFAPKFFSLRRIGFYRANLRSK